ncbi:MAG: ABC transporter ATP-binding protein [Bacilli bacterium]|jgi:multidrug/hemolysin transport system ATP-binding protein
MKNIINVNHLTKKYNKLVAVNDISFNVKEGSFFAFLGPNGAGKSTTINILCTILDRTSGEIDIDGYKLGVDDENIRNCIGVVFQNSHLDDLLTVAENIKTRAQFYNLTNNEFTKRLDYIAKTIGISDILSRQYGKLSGGQKRRVDIARALINQPKILFLDEPTTGLDPQTRKKVWEVLENIQKDNHTTIFLTTHYMEEASNADNIAIIDNGKIIVYDTPMKLKEKYTTNLLRLLSKNEKKVIKYLDAKDLKYSIKADFIEVLINNSLESLQILKDIEEDLSSFEVLEGNMDTVFINLTGKDIREE